MSSPRFENASLAGFAAEAAKTPEIRNLLKALLSGVLHGWGDKGVIRPELARHARRILARQHVKSGQTTVHPDLVDLLQHPEVVAYIRSDCRCRLLAAAQTALINCQFLPAACWT